MKFQHFESDIDGKKFDHLAIFVKDIFIGTCALEYNKDTAYITNLAVNDISYRQGFGSELLTLSKELCKKRGIESISLTVKKESPHVINFYKNNGFFISLDYGDGTLLMTKAI